MFFLNYYYFLVFLIIYFYRLPNGGVTPGGVVWEERINDPREERSKRNKQEITDLADVMHNLRPCKLYNLSN